MAHPQAEVLALLRRYGRNLHSFVALEPGLHYWFAEDRQAVVAYADRGGYWMAAGGPICERSRLSEVARAFCQAARQRGRKAAFFGLSERGLQGLGEGFDRLKIGLQPCWNPSGWEALVAGNRKLRQRLRTAQRDRVRVRRLQPEELESLRGALEELAMAWVEGHSLPPMGFMVTLDLFGHPQERRYFLAEQEGRPIGLAVAVPIYGQQGFLVEDMLVDRGAAQGTSEALIDQVMRSLAAEGAALVSLGMVALAGLEPDPGHALLSWLLRQSYQSMNGLYGFQGLYRFRSKLQPDLWEGVYLVAERVTPFTVRAVLMAFAQGWVPLYGARALLWLLPRWALRLPEGWFGWKLPALLALAQAGLWPGRLALVNALGLGVLSWQAARGRYDLRLPQALRLGLALQLVLGLMGGRLAAVAVPWVAGFYLRLWVGRRWLLRAAAARPGHPR